MHASIAKSDLGWLAGIIDGEGSIGAYKLNGPGRSPSIQLTIANSDWRVIERVKLLINQITGHHVSARPMRRKGKICDCCVVYLTKGSTIRLLLGRILRYLILKRAQAALAYEILCRKWHKEGIPAWVNKFGTKIRWFNSHRQRADGTWYMSASALTRQSRGKPIQSEPVETIQVTPTIG